MELIVLFVFLMQEAEEFRRSLIRYEMEMLKVFGFITHVEHPHKLLLNYIQILGLAKGMEHDESEFPGFVQEAWNIANDRCAWRSDAADSEQPIYSPSTVVPPCGGLRCRLIVASLQASSFTDSRH